MSIERALKRWLKHSIPRYVLPAHIHFSEQVEKEIITIKH